MATNSTLDLTAEPDVETENRVLRRALFESMTAAREERQRLLEFARREVERGEQMLREAGLERRLP